MIRRFLVYGKQIYLTPKRLEETEGFKTKLIELLLPLKLFWELEKELQHIDYMIATHEDPVVVNDRYRKFLQSVVSYTVTEKDRLLLNELIRSNHS